MRTHTPMPTSTAKAAVCPATSPPIGRSDRDIAGKQSDQAGKLFGAGRTAEPQAAGDSPPSASKLAAGFSLARVPVTASYPPDAAELASGAPSTTHGAEQLPHREILQLRFGSEHDLSSVRARVGSGAAEEARRLRATAFTRGEEIGFARWPSLELAAHEAAHVIQQRLAEVPIAPRRAPLAGQRGAPVSHRGVGAGAVDVARRAEAAGGVTPVQKKETSRAAGGAARVHDLTRVAFFASSEAPSGIAAPGPQLHARGGALTISAPGDANEQEAERAAHRIIRFAEPRKQGPCACGGECPRCRSKQPSYLPQFLREARISENDAGGIAPPIVHDVLGSPGQPMDPATLAYFEPRFGTDLSQVRVHVDGKATESARAIGAAAYTAGFHIVYGSGELPGQNILTAHELAHVLQQRTQSAGSPIRIQRQTVTYDKYLKTNTNPGEALGCLWNIKNNSKSPTNIYMDTACDEGYFLTSLAGVEYLPEDHADAFGHCWIGCQGAKTCGVHNTQNYGRAYENLREAMRYGSLTLLDHNSYEEDNFNREYGAASAQRKPVEDCFDSCYQAAVGRALKFHHGSDAPRGMVKVYLCSKTTIAGTAYSAGWHDVPLVDLFFADISKDKR